MTQSLFSHLVILNLHMTIMYIYTGALTTTNQLPIGTTQLTFTATDNCANSVTHTYSLTVTNFVSHSRTVSKRGLSSKIFSMVLNYLCRFFPAAPSFWKFAGHNINQRGYWCGNSAQSSNCHRRLIGWYSHVFHQQYQPSKHWPISKICSWDGGYSNHLLILISLFTS